MKWRARVGGCNSARSQYRIPLKKRKESGSQFLFKKQKVSVLQQVCGSESAHAAAHDHHVVIRRHRRPREYLAVAHLMADLVFFAIYRGSGSGIESSDYPFRSDARQHY